MKDWTIEKMLVKHNKKLTIINENLIECSSDEGESNSYKAYYYIEKLASYGHIPSMITLDIMKQDGVGCDKRLEVTKLDIAEYNNE